MSKPKIDSATFEFIQEADGHSSNQMQSISIECKSDFGIEEDEGCFFVIKTEEWSVDNADELSELLNRVTNMLFKKPNKTEQDEADRS
jgi:hypothetical protein